jgi:hypothetical protein
MKFYTTAVAGVKAMTKSMSGTQRMSNIVPTLERLSAYSARFYLIQTLYLENF